MAVLLVSQKTIHSLIFFLFIIFFLQIHYISANPVFFHYCNNKIGIYTNNSNFQSNLNTIISAINTTINSHGFYSNSLGEGVDRVNAIGFCRGDIDIVSCRNCLNDAARELVTLLCPNQMEAIRWYEECMFRYSTNKILGILSLDSDPSFSRLNPGIMSNPDSFGRELHSLAGDLVAKAYSGTFLKYAGLKSTDQNGQTIFGLMQCTPDITPNDCMSCLQSCENYLSPTYNHQGARLVTSSCTFRYEIYSFLNNISNQLPSSPPPLLVPSSTSLRSSTKPTLPVPSSKSPSTNPIVFNSTSTTIVTLNTTITVHGSNSTTISNTTTITTTNSNVSSAPSPSTIPTVVSSSKPSPSPSTIPTVVSSSAPSPSTIPTVVSSSKSSPSPSPLTTLPGNSKTVIIDVCVIVASLILTIIAASVFFTRRRWQNTRRGHRLDDKEEIEELKAIGDIETRQYDFALIRAATKDFSTANLLGSGGFGDVYKGILTDGKEIAVKRLSTASAQGENEFRNEVTLLAKLHHKCLVRLLGFCLEKTERVLVYEFMENGSLDKVLFDLVNRSRLDWEKRYQILYNIAKGLLYLHEDSRLMIIHRDLKASNILLDKDMNAKISDFGTARLFVRDESEANTKRIAGTMGYMAPEYAMHGLFSVKSDVYSYGVLLLEIISGKRTYYSLTEDSSEDLLSYAYKRWKDGRVSDLIDPVLVAHSYRPEIIIRCTHIALLCVQENVGSRPTMATVVLMLQSLTMTLPLPSDPGFFSNMTAQMLESQQSTSSSSQSKSKSLHTIARNGTSFTDDETDSYLYPR